MPQLELIGVGLDKKIDPNKKYEIAKITNKFNQSRYFVVEKSTMTPVCANHWNNDLGTVTTYIQSLKSSTQSKCVGCGMANECKMESGCKMENGCK